MDTNEENNKEASKGAIARKHCLLLLDQDKFKRRKCYVDLRKHLLSEQFTPDDLREIFNETHIYILNGLRDKSEAVREECIKFLEFLIIDLLPLNDYYLTYLFPVIVERIGTVELVEESEEIRLLMVKLVKAIVLKYSNTTQIKPFVNDVVTILCQTLLDKFPDIKIASCDVVRDLAVAAKREFYQHSLSLVKPTISCFKHQRSKVRLAAIKALGDIVMNCECKAIEESFTPLAERLFDSHAEVRVAVSQVTAKWMTEYIDRYSFFPKLLPLILSGLNDEVPSTRKIAHELWDKIGLQYQRENENDLKDQLDFLSAPPKYYPENLKRPNLGCRVLVQRNVSKIAPALMHELSSWQEDVTLRCSQLLVSVVLHAEEVITQHLELILPAMSIAVRDDQKITVANITQAAELLGFFVPPKSWTKLVLPPVENAPHEGHLAILASFVKGCPKEYVFEHLNRIARLLSEDYICQTRKKKVQKSLVQCLRAIEEKYKNPQERCLETERNLFFVAVTLVALGVDEKDALLSELQTVLGLNSPYELWSPHLPDLLKRIDKDPKGWNVLTPERCIFEKILLHSDEAFGENLNEIGAILKATLDVEADAESRLQTFTALSHSFDKKHIIFKRSCDLNEFLENLVTDVLSPTLVWHAGRTAEAMRTIAAVCLCSALTPTENVSLFTSKTLFRGVFDKILPLLVSLLEDASATSRKFALKDVTLLKELACKNDCYDLEDLTKIYPEILKRLDDPKDDVRNDAVRALGEILKDAPDAFATDTFKPHHELLIDTLLIHFTDDNDRPFQELILGVLKIMSKINRKVLELKVNARRVYFEKIDGCRDIVTFMEELRVN